VTISRSNVMAGLGSGATAWVVYWLLGGEKIAPILTFPTIDGVRLADLGMAVVLGVVGGVLGLVYGKGLVTTRVGLSNLRRKPWLAGLAGGVVTMIVALVSPRLLFSGQAQVTPVITNAATLGVLVLVDSVWRSWHSTHGPVNRVFRRPHLSADIQRDVFRAGVQSTGTRGPAGSCCDGPGRGMVVSAAVAPLSVTVFLALICDPDLTSIIAIAAVSAFIVRQLLAPTIPGVYRATRAEERKYAAAAETTG